MSHHTSFFDGCIACAEGKPKIANPYPEDSRAHAFWNRGYNDEFKRLPRPLQEARLARENQPPEKNS